eukprot:2602681-Prymnesium_polylepis.1
MSAAAASTLPVAARPSESTLWRALMKVSLFVCSNLKKAALSPIFSSTLEDTLARGLPSAAHGAAAAAGAPASSLGLAIFRKTWSINASLAVCS